MGRRKDLVTSVIHFLIVAAIGSIHCNRRAGRGVQQRIHLMPVSGPDPLPGPLRERDATLSAAERALETRSRASRRVRRASHVRSHVLSAPSCA